MRKTTYAISGLFLTRKTTGMERYAIEVAKRLTQLVDEVHERIVIVVPEGTAVSDDILRSHIVEYGRAGTGNLRGYLWEQIAFARYLRKYSDTGYLPLNFVPFAAPEVVVTIHDGNALTHPEYYPTFGKKMYRCLAIALLQRAKRRARFISTVSESSRRELVEDCGFPTSKVSVAFPGLDHATSETTFASESLLNVIGVREESDSSFYLALSSATYNKNFEWVVEAALANAQETFVIAGGGDFRAMLKSLGYESVPPNIRYVGYVTNAERNWLYANCKAFIFPSRYEGFGLPPLEAAYFGAPIVSSPVPSMTENIDVLTFVDVESPPSNLEQYINHLDPERLKERYKWENTSNAILKLLRAATSGAFAPATRRPR